MDNIEKTGYTLFDTLPYDTPAELAKAFNNASEPGKSYAVVLAKGDEMMRYLSSAMTRYQGYCPWKKYRVRRGEKFMFIADLTEPGAEENYIEK